MYRLITDIIQKEYQADVKSNQTFRQFFETNFINTFQVVSSEELTDFNQHLLDTQINYYRDFISKITHLSNESSENDTTNTTNTTNTADTAPDNLLLHSYQRTINLTNSSRHNYRINHTFKGRSLLLEKIILPIEETSLFMNPLLSLVIDTKLIELHLRGTIQLRERLYGMYAPFFETPLQITSDTMRIQFRPQLGGARKGCDVYPIVESNHTQITVECNKEEFMKGDTIRLCNFKNKELDDTSVLQSMYVVQNLLHQDNQLVITLPESVQDITGLYVMNMSLQNTIQFQ